MRLYVVSFDSVNCTPDNICYEINECIDPRFNSIQGETWQFPFLCDELARIEPISSSEIL
jgi:hypothetical protein